MEPDCQCDRRVWLLWFKSHAASQKLSMRSLETAEAMGYRSSSESRESADAETADGSSGSNANAADGSSDPNAETADGSSRTNANAADRSLQADAEVAERSFDPGFDAADPGLEADAEAADRSFDHGAEAAERRFEADAEAADRSFDPYLEDTDREANVPWSVRNRHLVGNKFLLKLFLAKTVPEVTLLWANFAFDPRSLTDRLGDDGSKICNSNNWAYFVNGGVLLYSTALFVFAATRYGALNFWFARVFRILSVCVDFVCIFKQAAGSCLATRRI